MDNRKQTNTHTVPAQLGRSLVSQVGAPDSFTMLCVGHRSGVRLTESRYWPCSFYSVALDVNCKEGVKS